MVFHIDSCALSGVMWGLQSNILLAAIASCPEEALGLDELYGLLWQQLLLLLPN